VRVRVCVNICVFMCMHMFLHVCGVLILGVCISIIKQ
jgi:hypothetical protein